MIVFVVVFFPLASVVAPIDPAKIEIKEIGLAPGPGHLLGTDLTGRDVWSRVIYGGRVSMSVGIVAVALYITIGTILGSVSGYYGGRTDALIMRVTDTVMAFPTLIILITIVSFIGPGIFNSMLAIGLIGWTGVARLVRSLILSIREMDYVMAAHAVGVEQKWIIMRHILPNVVAPHSPRRRQLRHRQRHPLPKPDSAFWVWGYRSPPPDPPVGATCSTRRKTSRSSKTCPGSGYPPAS